MRPGFGTFGARSAQALFSAACLAVGAYAFAYLYLPFRPGDAFAAEFAVSGWNVPAHFFGAGLALVLVPLQLSRGIRRRWPGVHRIGGWLSAAAILIGGVSGLSLAQHAQGGLVSSAGFTLLSLLWLGSTANGIRLAIRGESVRHRRWMACSMALTSAAVTLRVLLGIGAGLLQLPFMPVYIATAWVSWLLNLALCAWLLRVSDRRRVKPGAALPASRRGAAGRGPAFRRRAA